MAATIGQDTIAAAATPPGRGGVGIIRVSGPAARNVGEALFASSRADFSGFLPHRLHHGVFLDERGAVLDEILAAFMPGPNSYTGEDVLEFHCHGGPVVLRRGLAAVFASGARPAEAGEFTKRAYLNGRLDLTRAEAVAELINAGSAVQADMAAARLRGLAGDRTQKLRAALEALRAKLCLAVDFPEEDVECLGREEFAEAVEDIAARIRELLSVHERSRPWREGALAVLFGRVNAGKSSLFNALLGRERAIVAALPGTTRDFLEEGLDLDGLPVRLADTAGLRRTDDQVERIGLDRSLELARQADLGLYVVDGAAPFAAGADSADADASISELLLETLGPKRILAVCNKADLPPADPDPAAACAALGFEVVRLSAVTGEGLNDLPAAMRRRLLDGAASPEAARNAPNEREARALAAALEELDGLAADIKALLPYDLLGVRLETAGAFLAEITGEITSDEVVNAVFDAFCIGK